ncbi:WGR domain-containing protein [Neorhizobium sp. T7_12]|uniref:WGR domain-containing protein n=1 Tax=Neorhizobium sp. T7_12 TaxID=2093832 RepID=UPI000CFA33BE|nr:WGR domain-containing protein [Neorhizobium sp. T7_12]
MATYPFRLYCQRIDATKNMARYYALSMQPTLSGEVAGVRRWGRIGGRGGEKTEVFATEREAAMHFLDLARRKRQKAIDPETVEIRGC